MDYEYGIRDRNPKIGFISCENEDHARDLANKWGPGVKVIRRTWIDGEMTKEEAI